jgi:hypothetical protein
LVLAILGGAWKIHHTIQSLKTQVTTLTSERDDARVKVKLQNSAIELMAEQEKARTLKANEDLAKAQTESKTHKDTSKTILATQPSNPQDLCSSANELINQELKK